MDIEIRNQALQQQPLFLMFFTAAQILRITFSRHRRRLDTTKLRILRKTILRERSCLGPMSLVGRNCRFDNSHYFQADIAVQQRALRTKHLKLLFFFAAVKLLNNKIVSRKRRSGRPNGGRESFAGIKIFLPKRVGCVIRRDCPRGLGQARRADHLFEPATLGFHPSRVARHERGC